MSDDSAGDAAAAPAHGTPDNTPSAAAIDAMLQGMTDAEAKTVPPKDLVNPINSELLGAPGNAPTVSPYTGKTDDYVRWKRDITNCISTAGLGWASQFFRSELQLEIAPVVGAPVFVHSHYPVLTKQRAHRLNEARTATIARGADQVYGIVLASIDAAVAEAICDGGAGVGRDPDKLVAAITAHARGPHAKNTGANAVRQFYALQWNGKAATLAGQVDASFADMHRLQRITSALNEDGYNLTAQQLMVKVVSMMPADLDVHSRTYENCTELTTLQAEMKKDAARLDNSVAAGLKSFVTQGDRLSEFEARIEKRIAELTRLQAAGGGSGSGGTRTQHSRAVLSNKSNPPDSNRRWKWCDHHNSWSTSHDSEHCYKAHPELRPKLD